MSDYHTIGLVVTFRKEEWGLDCEGIYTCRDTLYSSKSVLFLIQVPVVQLVISTE